MRSFCTKHSRHAPRHRGTLLTAASVASKCAHEWNQHVLVSFDQNCSSPSACLRIAWRYIAQLRDQHTTSPPLQLVPIRHDGHQDGNIVLFPTHEIQPFLYRATHERRSRARFLACVLCGFTERLGKRVWRRCWGRRVRCDDLENIFVELVRRSARVPKKGRATYQIVR